MLTIEPLIPLTDEQRMILMWVILSLIAAYFIIINLPVKHKRKDPWKNVRNRNRAKAKKTGKNGKR